MKRRHVTTTVFIGATVVVLAACSSSSKSSDSTTPTQATVSTPSQPAATVPTPKPTLRAETNAKLGKPIIVNIDGQTVYMFVPDGTSKKSTVPAAIKSVWPPVISKGAVIVGSGLTATKLATDMQADGTSQVSYNGHLLYTFANDKAPGDAGGQGLGGAWFVLSPTGDKVS